MVFSSSTFLFCFLPAVLLLYYIVPARLKNFILLLASLLFYMWNKPEYISLILISITINYIGGLLIGTSRTIPSRRIALTITIALNVSLLVIFKYTDFIIKTINDISGSDISLTGIVLPIGISFYTFQGLSYVIDVYKKTCLPCKNPFDIALYISLFPQLVAGPIVKYNEIYLQISYRKTTIQNFADGIIRFIVGLSKKVLLANVLGETADDIFGSFTGGIDTITAWVGIICYTLQIYFDFSGYSDMAIGLGKMFGFKFPENFNYPYISKSITEFWRRWHISLSTWFRDYIYIPLGGSRKGNASLHLLIVFFITGLWHGASWNFVIWGMWYGVLLVLEKPLLKTSFYNKIPGIIRWTVTILIVMIGWVFFRAENLTQATDYILCMLGVASVPSDTAHFSYLYYLDNRLIFTLATACICSLPVWKKRALPYIEKYTIARIFEFAIIFGLFVLNIICIINNVYNPFIYFQF
ncbi:MAG: MBOAT family protein [Lachnospiraceae bacterium]|nr:MBOAT family protein [Lachnospiraceae bacterium]